MKRTFTLFRILEKRISGSLLWLSLITIQLWLHSFAVAQLGTPQVESVYGGRINWISSIPTSATSSRVFISTESANSMFYADIANVTTVPAAGSFQVIPDLSADDNYGSGIQRFDADSASGRVFLIYQTGLLSVTPTASSLTTVVSGNINAVLCYKGNLYFVQDGNQFHFGTIDATTGAFTEGTGSPVAIAISGMMMLKVNPVNNLVYAFAEGGPPTILASTDMYNALSGATTFSTISTTGLGSDLYRGFGIGPDGRLFTGKESSGIKAIAYTDDTTWTIVSTGVAGTYGANIETAGSDTNYYVYYGSGVSTHRGNDGTWATMPNGGTAQTHPNDGAVIADPLNSAVIYLTTDQGIGMSSDNGVNLVEIDNGVEATQVKDFDMNASKSTAWLASKSGIRRVTGYQTTPVWSSAIFPNGDGSPYYSADMDASDTSGNTAYVGNSRIYKTTDGGTNWTQQYTAESLFSFGSYVSTIEVDPYNSNRVWAGYYDQQQTEGGLFYTENGGSTWSQFTSIDLPTDGMDVNDVIVSLEGTDTVAYVAVSYDLSSPAGWGVYKIKKDSTGYTVTHDMSAFVVTIRDLALDASGGIYACGTDAGTNHPVAYYKASGGSWTVLTVSGFPTSQEGRAVTVGKDSSNNDVPLVAVGSSVYVLGNGASGWTLGYTYPAGTEINVLYWDALLVGTGTGIYGQSLSIGSVPAEATKYRTFKISDGLSSKPKKLKFKKVKSVGYRLVEMPTEATVLANEFVKIGKGSPVLLGLKQTAKDSVKKYAWVEFTNAQGKAAETIGKLFTSSHTGAAYPLDSTRKNGKVKKMRGAQKPDVKNYNNIAIEQGVLFNLNLKASSDSILPYGFGNLVLNVSNTLMYAGRQLNGMSLTNLGALLDTTMTFWNQNGINSTEGYAQLQMLIDSVIKPINDGFGKDIDTTNFIITDSTGMIKNKAPYAVHLLGVKTADEVGIVKEPTVKTQSETHGLVGNNEPLRFTLGQNYPNPFNPVTVIAYTLPSNSIVSLKVYDVLGREVAALMNNELNVAGAHSVEFDASRLSSGVYFYRLNVNNGEFTAMKKMLLLK